MTKHKISASIYNKSGKLLVYAENNYNRTHPIQAFFANSVNEPKRIFLHAEIAALIKLKKTDIPYKIYISRIKKNGIQGCAAPCAICQAALKHWGIQKIEYTI